MASPGRERRYSPGAPEALSEPAPCWLFSPQGEIRATAFNDQADKFFPLIEMNKVLGGVLGWGVPLPRSAAQGAKRKASRERPFSLSDCPV